MVNVAFKKGLSTNLPEQLSAGTFYVTTDEGAMYLDVDASTRLRFSDFQPFSNLTELQPVSYTHLTLPTKRIV